MKKVRTRGFTLIELLVVIAIIALLLSILMPSLNKAKFAARKVVCSSNLHGVGLGLTVGAQNNKDKYYKRVLALPQIVVGNASMRKGDPLVEELLSTLESAIAGGSSDIFWCPFTPESQRPPKYQTDYAQRHIGLSNNEKWEKIFNVGSNGEYLCGYNIFAGMEYPGDSTSQTSNFDWSHSGNPKRSVGGSKEVIASDICNVYYISNAQNSTGQTYASHGKPQIGRGGFKNGNLYFTNFSDTQAVYGDGHVEKKTKQENLKWVGFGIPPQYKTVYNVYAF